MVRGFCQLSRYIFSSAPSAARALGTLAMYNINGSMHALLDARSFQGCFCTYAWKRALSLDCCLSDLRIWVGLLSFQRGYIGTHLLPELVKQLLVCALGGLMADKNLWKVLLNNLCIISSLPSSSGAMSMPVHLWAIMQRDRQSLCQVFLALDHTSIRQKSALLQSPLGNLHTRTSWTSR